MKIEYDPSKEQENIAKHGVDFAEAASAVLEPLAFDREDLSAIGERRFLTLGMSKKNRVLVVVTTHRGQTVRIISAWPANKHHRESYEKRKDRR